MKIRTETSPLYMNFIYILLPECDGEVHEVPGLITDCNYSGLGVDDGAGVELLLVHAVDDVPLRAVGPTGADDVDLVIFPGQSVFIHFHNVLIVCTKSSTKYWVRDVPVNINGRGSPDWQYH